MTFLGLGEMFEGYSAETFVKKNVPSCLFGAEWVSRLCRHRSEDPHRLEWKFPGPLHQVTGRRWRSTSRSTTRWGLQHLQEARLVLAWKSQLLGAHCTYCRRPTKVPLYLREEVTARLEADLKNGTLESMPMGEKDTGCSRMVIKPKQNGRARRTVDLSGLSKAADMSSTTLNLLQKF